jgi:NADPH:quinone reductase
MRALVMDEPGKIRVDLDRAVPVPADREIRVRVRATALNRADLLQTMGLYPAPPGVPADIPGLEYAGEVDAVGPLVSRFRLGDKVMGLVAGGAWADMLCVHESEAMAVPQGIDLEHAAAIPEAFLTAWDALELQAGLKAGHWALVHAVSSGVGTAAIQLIALRGAKAIGTSRSQEKLKKALEVAPFESIQTSPGLDFSPAVLNVTGGHGADVVLDLVGGDLTPFTLASTAERGTVMVVGLTAGPNVENFPLRTVLSRRLTVRGTTLRSRSHEEKSELARRFSADVLPHFQTGKLKPVVSQVIDAADANDALAAMMRNETFGKVVLAFHRRVVKRGL